MRAAFERKLILVVVKPFVQHNEGRRLCVTEGSIWGGSWEKKSLLTRRNMFLHLDVRLYQTAWTSRRSAVCGRSYWMRPWEGSKISSEVPCAYYEGINKIQPGEQCSLRSLKHANIKMPAQCLEDSWQPWLLTSTLHFLAYDVWYFATFWNGSRPR